MTQYYCRTKNTFRPLDSLEYGFLFAVAAIIVINVIGTVYDLTRNTDHKPNQLLMAWSFRRSWNRFTADHSDGDPRLCALKPTHGMKGCLIILVVIGHSMVGHHMTYLYNPQYFEEASYYMFTLMYTNGASIIQSYLLISSFLLGYHMLINNEISKTSVSLMKLPKYIGYRLIRLVPLNLFVIWLAATWWSRAGDGPQMFPLLGTKSATCRRNWWTQALFINNLVRPSEPCMIHSWYLAVDTQLFMVMVVLSLVLVKYPRAAVRLLAGLIVAAVAMNFFIAYHWDLKPGIAVINPESMRKHFVDTPSFHWQYSAPWSSLPSALIGLLVAFMHYLQQVDGYQPGQSKVVRILHRLSLPIGGIWIIAGCWMRDVTDPFWVAVYVALDRPVVAGSIAFAMYGFFNSIDEGFWKWLSWRGWVSFNRMSLTIYLMHWLLSFQVLALRVSVTRASFFDICAHWVGNLPWTYIVSLPLHLLLELPAAMFLRNLID